MKATAIERSPFNSRAGEKREVWDALLPCDQLTVEDEAAGQVAEFGKLLRHVPAAPVLAATSRPPCHARIVVYGEAA